MSQAFTLRWKVDPPFLLQNQSDDVHTLLTIEPAHVPGNQVSSLPAHLFVLVDVSASMDYLIRPDPFARILGEVLTEGQASRQVASQVPSRREVACAVVEKLIGRLGPDDRLSVIAFDDRAHVLAHQLAATSMAQVRNVLVQLAHVGGGGTSLGRGLQAVRRYLSVPENRTRKLVLLTDGEDQEAQLSLAEAQAVGRDLGVPIVALGTGECKVAFLSEVARTSLAGAFNHVRTETDAEQFFDQVLTGQKNVQATNVVLKLWLSPEIFVRELYRTRPEILYVGDLRPDAQNVVELRLEQMERGKAYEFLFRCTLPGRPSRRFRIAKATLSYDLPAAQRVGETVETNIVVTFTEDGERARERSGDVRRVLARAEVQRQVLFLQEKIDALNQGRADERDRALIANLLRALIQKFEEFNDRPMVNMYKTMQDEFQRGGTIAQEMLNRSLAASSRAEEVIMAQDIDF
jgi:Ca-activated chloride channel family protein